MFAGAEEFRGIAFDVELVEADSFSSFFGYLEFLPSVVGWWISSLRAE